VFGFVEPNSKSKFILKLGQTKLLKEALLSYVSTSIAFHGHYFLAYIPTKVPMWTKITLLKENLFKFGYLAFQKFKCT
jgi:hypothetical protein